MVIHCPLEESVQTKIGVNKSIKVASEKSAVNALSELVKEDKSYAAKTRKHTY